MRPPARHVFAAIILASSAVSAFAGQESVGVTGAVNPQAIGQAPTGPVEQLAIGQNVVRNEKISTFNKGQVQLIFSDQSTLTLAENSEIVIDEFVYDPAKQAGTMTATVTTGVLRYVGGKISKKSDVSFLTPSGVVTVRGGIALIKVTGKTRRRTGKWRCGRPIDATYPRNSTNNRRIRGSGDARAAGRHAALPKRYGAVYFVSAAKTPSHAAAAVTPAN